MYFCFVLFLLCSVVLKKKKQQQTDVNTEMILTLPALFLTVIVINMLFCITLLKELTSFIGYFVFH